MLINGQEFEWFGGMYAVGPHPETGERLRWFYETGNPPRPLSPEENEAHERHVLAVLEAFKPNVDRTDEHKSSDGA